MVKKVTDLRTVHKLCIRNHGRYNRVAICDDKIGNLLMKRELVLKFLSKYVALFSFTEVDCLFVCLLLFHAEIAELDL